MRYKVTLTTESGEVLEQWTVVMAQQAEIGDEFNLSKSAASQFLLSQMKEEIERADVRAMKGGK